jgi:hypothetical protein
VSLAVVNPFDPKTVLLAKHAQHVVLVHFPIALFLTAVGFDVAAQWTKKPVFATVARYNMMIAAIATLPVMLTGLLAWQWQLEGHKLKGILLQHLVLGVDSKHADLAGVVDASACQPHRISIASGTSGGSDGCGHGTSGRLPERN